MSYLVPFVVAMVVSMVWLPLLAKVAVKWGILDQPGVRKVHAKAIPRIGGIAMVLGVYAAALIAIDLKAEDRWFLLAAGVLVAFGALDDRFDLDYRIKFLGQILAVGIVVYFGDVRVRTITLDDRVLLSTWLSLPLTVIFLVGITNAINLADGLDGLAGGTTFLCLCAVALLSSVGDHNASTALCLAFAGAILGFLRFNTYPATVFMGDAGSQLLGFTIGVLSIRATQSAATQISAATPILLLAIPILDTLSVMVQRVSEGRSPFSADRNHIHHKLLALGFGHHEAVMVIYTVQAALFVLAYFLRYESDVTILTLVTAFFAAAIVLMQVPARWGWTVHAAKSADDSRPPNWRITELLWQRDVLTRFAHIAIGVALCGYTLVIISGVQGQPSDVCMLVVALLCLALFLLAIMRTRALTIVDKATLYVTATVIIYLDAASLDEGRIPSILSWVAISVVAVATALHIRLRNDRRFEITSLDLIVLFMALVVPSLPGTLHLPPGTALTIAKLVILFYALEVLIGRVERSAIWLRIVLVAALTGLATRLLAAL
jgi:UDP-GlcNAc:undecaprenyl-phosphate/decaprenyl-phosphate GlcNAc-1-phosphate transferase